LPGAANRGYRAMSGLFTEDLPYLEKTASRVVTDGDQFRRLYSVATQ
jgi:hypothetical protein